MKIQCACPIFVLLLFPLQSHPDEPEGVGVGGGGDLAGGAHSEYLENIIYRNKNE